MYAVKAVYRKGHVEFIDRPPQNDEVNVLVIFPDTDRNRNEESVRFQGTREMDKLLKQEPDWKPTSFIKR